MSNRTQELLCNMYSATYIPYNLDKYEILESNRREETAVYISRVKVYLHINIYSHATV